jgi:hypothetical protein
MGMAVLTGLDVLTLSENQEKIFAMLLISCIILFSGMISPRIPFTRHTGLRLPWTIRDEDTWKIPGLVSFLYYWKKAHGRL